MTQSDRIIAYIKEFGSITSLEAMRDLGVMRLASRISDLKDEGYRFRTETEKQKNRYGEDTHFARYYLEEAKHE